jgi:predicted DNA-binding transcriptional regulator AlpA
LSDAKLSPNQFSVKCKPKFLSFDPTHELSNNAIRFEGSFLDMNTAESSTNLIAMPGLAPHRDNVTSLFQQPRRLLDVGDVAKWLGVSKNWVRDHASGRRQPKLQAIKLGSRKGKDFGNSAKRTFNNFYATAILGKTKPLAGLLSTKHVT